MGTLNDLLGGTVADPLEETRWLVLADWLEENDDPRRGELVRLHRKLLATCCEPDKHAERQEWQTRLVELITDGVGPCVPQWTLMLPGEVPMTFSFVPPGSFLLGSDHFPDEGPVRPITLTRGFYLGVYTVTQAHWYAVMGTAPSHFKGAHHPVDQVSWTDATEFCERLTPLLNGEGVAALPTEAQWEYACRSGTRTEYHTGDGEAALQRAGWYSSNTKEDTTHQVGLLPPNPWGLFDMHGNVSEWVDGRPVFYRVFQECDPTGPPTDPNSQQGLRGGNCFSNSLYCRSASRSQGTQDRRFRTIGFRVAIRV